MPQQGARPLRALAPRTTLTPESGTPGPATEESKIKRASTACKECKRRRTKCSTGNPCTECAAHDRECVYDESADKRRKVAAKRAQEQLDYYRGLLERLLESIRYCERAEVDHIVAVIRGGASLDDISAVIEQSLVRRKHTDEERDQDYEDEEEDSDLMDDVLEDVP
ncbi:transcriptional regulator family: Fungal Specific TF [Paecilomyces variotii]|nr:transcriptional regulator family: Fungal Specific TF [Paecilomyces variotii]KAJ9262586.1 transcriptional regulator family: Fungal Specific TF [Paecilomyces variotii]KAJ9318577.1 transcriptional regulator family: Fungal Specific TF [Paecilomyces variotii]